MAVDFEAKGHVALITLNRSESMNAIDPETNDLLVAAWKKYRDDPSLRCAVLTGAGDKAFCAGADLKRMGEWYSRVPAKDRVEVWNREPGLGGITRNLDVGKPVIAAINGHCLGGGLELALACDIRLAAENATFAFPETKWGIIPGQGGTQRLPRTVNVGVALEMILSGDAIDAKRAFEIGLVSRVVPRRALMPGALALADTIASRSPAAVRAAREAVLQGFGKTLDEGLRLEQALADPLRDSEDNKEARRAFAEKREPKWKTG
ncbi:MAG: enoyl-CoA hydratase/isomerase family protein [Euryarchaeota archaeon]|nr:enoyl-CoA hydratase/isomerase family protein [Euryarchaeota archaeon]